MGGRARGPNIVWITLDSIRQDHTSLAGYDRVTTPNMDRIASRPAGRGFSNCFATAKWSLPSIASIHTGTYPEYHRTGYQTDVLPDHLDTVAELLSEQGYATTGVSANGYFCEATNLDRGFDRFTRINARNFVKSAGVGNFLRFLWNIRDHTGGFTLESLKHRPDYLVTERIKDEVRELSSGTDPFFVAAHYHGAHIPYYPPVTYQDAFLSELDLTVREAREIAFERTTDIYTQIARSHTFTDREWAAIVAMYDALVAYCDALVGDLFEFVRTHADDVIFVVTADHGDLLGEYGLLGHKLVLHDALVHVPMVTHGLDVRPGAEQELVQHVDVVRSIVDRAGGDTEQFQGVDLEAESRDAVISQRGDGGAEGLAEIRAHNPDFDGEFFHERELTAIRTQSFKYQCSPDGANLFELPDETTDVSAAYPDVATDLDRRLSEWREHAAGPEVREMRADFDEETRRRLADLGYLTD